MLRFKTFLICFFVAIVSAAHAGTYALKDGNSVSGDPMSLDNRGIKFKDAAGGFSERIPYEQFTQESIRLLLNDTKPGDHAFLEPFVEEMAQEKAAKKEITIKPVPAPERPTKHTGLSALFSSSVGIVILLILYGAILFAAYEVAVFRNQPVGLVMGLAAIPFLGFFSPIIFIAMPTRTASLEPVPVAEVAPEVVEPTAAEAEAIAVQEAQAAAAQAEAAAPTLPAPVFYRRGEFSFNRRFFETKLAGFFRLVPGPAEKDMIIRIKSSRGTFEGRHITKITQDELFLQTFNGTATADEMIPIIEVLEVEIRHKDLP